METREHYLIEAPQNGTGSPTAALDGPEEWWEADRLTVHLVLQKRRRHPTLGSVKVGEMHCLTQDQKPIAIAPAVNAPNPWGAALDQFITIAMAQAGERQG